VIGTVANLYFCYISFARYSIYSEISDNINVKFKEWTDNQNRNKEMVLELMREMESMKGESQGNAIGANNGYMAITNAQKTKESTSS